MAVYYKATILAILASLGMAARLDMASSQAGLTVDMDAASPPDVSAMAATASKVIDAKIAAADKALADAQKALMNLSTAVAGSNNTNKGMSAHDAVDAMMKANVEKAKAVEVKSKVDLMVEACTTLFAAVTSFKSNSEPRAALQREESKADMTAKIGELAKTTLEVEKLDLSNLLKLIEEIRAAQAKVENLDKTVGAGAAPAMVQATSLVYGYAEQLQARSEMLTAADAFAKMAPLTPADAKLKVDKQTEESLDKANDKIDEIIKLKTELAAKASQGLTVLATSTNAANATKMHGLIDEMMAANQAKAAAEALSLAIDEAIQTITNFFSVFAGYKSNQIEKKALALQQVDEITTKAAELKKQTDASVLLEVGAFFHLYQVMWLRATEAGAAMPEEDAAFTPVRGAIDTTATAVHEWLNGEISSLCEYYKTCQKARAELLKPLEAKAKWCDERFSKMPCIEGNEGHQPNGKMCKWHPAKPDLGIRSFCKQVNPPTKNLKFGRNDANPGIFY